MGLYLPGGDIHDFLACLGKHAVEKASFDLKTVEPECYNIVFVDDTDEFTHSADGFGLANKDEKEAAPGGWGEIIQKEDNPGWGAQPNSEAKSNAVLSDTGWGMAEAPPLEGGWCNEQVTVKDNGWDSAEKNEVDKAPPVSCEGGWGSKQDAAIDSGWDSFVTSNVDTTASAAQTDSMEGQIPTNQTSKGGFMHPSRRSMNAADSMENPGASERRSGNFAPSGTNTLPLGRRKNFFKANSAFANDEQFEEKGPMGWKATAPSAAGDDSGWGGSKRTQENATREGLGQDNWASGMNWETSCSYQLPSQNSNNDSLDKDGWQTVLESEMLGKNGWGNDNDWNCKGNSQGYETALSNAPDSWNAMEGQNARKGSNRLADLTDGTDKQSADERRSGKFAPSGSNTIPLGKRRGVMEPNISNNELESMVTKSAPAFSGNEDQAGWGNCKQSTAAEDFGWDNSKGEDKEMNEKNSEKELGNIDGCQSNSTWGKILTGQTNKGMENDSIGKDDWRSQFKGEESADLHGWGSEVRIRNDQDDGWDDIKSNSPSVPCSINRLKPSSSCWDSAVFKSSNTQPSRGSVEKDGTPMQRKRFNRDSSNDSWTHVASKSPQPQSRRHRLRSLMNSPEYSELDELYKKSNKILHHNEYQLGDKLNTEDEKFILEKILVHHQGQEAKVGCGVDYVMIDSHAEHQVSCFWVVRKDGTKTDFSYWKCLEGLYEKKYSQGVTKDGIKNESNDGWNWGSNSKALAKSDRAGAEVSWDMGVSSAGPSKNMFDKEEPKGSWDMGASCEAPVEGIYHGEANDSWNMGARSAVSTKDQGNGWNTCSGYAAPIGIKCDQEDAKDSWDMGANSTMNVCDQATRKDAPQEDAKDGWEGL